MKQGDIYHDLNNFELAIESYTSSLKIARSNLAFKLEAKALLGLGHTYNSLQQYSEAIKYFEQGVSITEQMGDSQSAANFWLELGNARKKVKEKTLSPYNAYKSAYKLFTIGSKNHSTQNFDELIKQQVLNLIAEQIVGQTKKQALKFLTAQELKLVREVETSKTFNEDLSTTREKLKTALQEANWILYQNQERGHNVDTKVQVLEKIQFDPNDSKQFLKPPIKAYSSRILHASFTDFEYQENIERSQIKRQQQNSGNLSSFTANLKQSLRERLLHLVTNLVVLFF